MNGIMRQSTNIPRPLTPPKPSEIRNRMITRSNRSSFTTADITTTRTNLREWNIFHPRHRYITRITVRRNGNMDCAGALTNAGFVSTPTQPGRREGEDGGGTLDSGYRWKKSPHWLISPLRLHRLVVSLHSLWKDQASPAQSYDGRVFLL